MDKTVFFSESGSWDNMVNLSTKSFPGAHILVGARKVRVNASKKGRRPVLRQRPFWPGLINVRQKDGTERKV